MLEADITKLSLSARQSPVVLIPKKDGGPMFSVNYLKLNAVMYTDYLHPTEQEILQFNTRNGI